MKSSQRTFVFVEMMFAAAVLVAADTPQPGSAPMLSLSATTANVMGAPDSIRIDLFRWSTDSERNQLMSAWNNPAAAQEGGRGGRGAGAGRGGRGAGAGRGGRGGASATDTSADANASDDAPAVRNRSASDSTSGPTPESALAAAVKRTTSVGYLWSSEVAGYGIRYAGKVTTPDGAERVILITDRRLGKTNDLWTPVSGEPSTSDFSVIELHINSGGEGEGKIALTGKVAADTTAGIVVPQNYGALPVVLKNVKHRNTGNK